MSRWKTYAVVAVVMLLLAAAVLPAYAQLDQWQSDLDKIRDQIDNATEEVKQVQARMSKVEAELAEYSRELNRAEATLRNLNQQISTLEKEIDEQEELIEIVTLRINETEEYLEEQNEYLDHRLRAIYQNGAVTYLEVLFSASSFSDFLSRFNFLRSIIESDVELVNEIKALRAELEKDRLLLEDVLAQLVLDREQLVVSRELATREEQRISGLVANQRSLQAQLQSEIAALSRVIGELKDEEDEIEEMIRRAQAEHHYDPGVAPSVFLWPTPGFRWVSSPYGWRTIFGAPNFHRGIDIAGSGINRTPIVASAPGVVMVVQYGSSYGWWVAINHGAGYSTRYAHMAQRPDVNVGDFVTMGQRIGLVGSTGNSTGPHLHFEIRVNGVDRNPQNYQFIYD